ncbi:glycoside hydrolase family 13 protein [Lepidopterella palustris CBS 459.81]|uniref:Glycoside hydrolase family 13 protein n=1 Tax=Lepidopterella palustris CBS 459.81 TaxID=1314670 RepID=A0A8E2EJD7_9PEZI|nr:glycoside hydrolase family 13 protein [Lepidopterella palustris CBS 459.81]
MLEKLIPTSTSPATGPLSINDSQVKGLLAQSQSTPGNFHASPAAWEDQQLYFLLPDRFSNNEEDGYLDSNGQPVSGSIKMFNASSDSANAISSPQDAQTWRDAGGGFVGGTLQGVKSKLGYLKRLGVTALWVGPVFKQVPNDPSLYHGYAVQDFLQIDPRFGTREDLRDLVKDAHKQGIYVILDIILNHSGDVFAYKGGDKNWAYPGIKYDVEGFRDSHGNPTLPFQTMDLQKPPDNFTDCAVWPIELQAPGSFTCEGSILNWDNDPEYILGDFLSLKDINLGPSNPDNFSPTPALQALCLSYKYWIAYADLDGFRVDTVKHMGNGPTRYLATTIHEFAGAIGKDNFLLVGEVTGNAAWETVEITGIDAALGIGNVQQELWNLPKGYANPNGYFDLFRNALYLNVDAHSWTRNKIVTMLDDHDQVWRGGSDKARFCSGQQGDKLVLAALALNLTTLGIPCIYYGTEQSLDGSGGSDHYIREALFGGQFGPFRSANRHCFNEQNPVYQEVGKICALRQKHLTLRHGRQYLREISGDGQSFGVPVIIGDRMLSIVAWSRIFADEEILCAINTNPDGPSSAWVTLDNTLHDEGSTLAYVYPTENTTVAQSVTVVALNGKAVFLTVPAGGFVVFK